MVDIDPKIQAYITVKGAKDARSRIGQWKMIFNYMC